MARVLAIETSGRPGSIAVLRDDGPLVERPLPNIGRGHAKSLVAEMSALLRAEGLGWSDLDGVAASVGPGSFTGLRVGVVAAKTVAWATGCRLVAVDTFDAIAAAVPADHARFTVIDDAQRGEVFLGRYLRDDDGRPRAEGPITVRPVDEWLSDLSLDDVLTGPGVTRFADRLGDRARLIEESRRVPSAGYVAAIGAALLEAGTIVDPVALVPRYLRRSSAEERWDRVHGTT